MKLVSGILKLSKTISQTEKKEKLPFFGPFMAKNPNIGLSGVLLSFGYVSQILYPITELIM